MLGIILGTHGKLSQELLHTGEMIMGKLEKVETVSLLPGEGLEQLKGKYQQAIENLGTENILILTDIFGGSPYNSASTFVAENEQYGIVTGVNLPMLLEMVNYRYSLAEGEALDMTTVLEKAVVAGQSGMQKLHKSLLQNNLEEKEDEL